MYIYIYTCMYTNIYVRMYTYTYICIQRKREWPCQPEKILGYLFSYSWLILRHIYIYIYTHTCFYVRQFSVSLFRYMFLSFFLLVCMYVCMYEISGAFSFRLPNMKNLPAQCVEHDEDIVSGAQPQFLMCGYVCAYPKLRTFRS